MRIIFLDVDGVLNTAASFERRHGDVVDPACVARFNRLIDETGARVVLSSTWRLARGFRTVLRDLGVRANIVDRTPYFTDGRRRGHEIAAWLAANPGVTSYVILDDEDDMLPGQPLVRTRLADGLTDADVERAKAMLLSR